MTLQKKKIDALTGRELTALLFLANFFGCLTLATLWVSKAHATNELFKECTNDVILLLLHNILLLNGWLQGFETFLLFTEQVIN